MKNIVLFVDKRYINKSLKPELKLEKNINLLFLKRGNSNENYPKRNKTTSFKGRRRIEVSFSQLT